MKTIIKFILITIAILMSNLNYGAHIIVPVSACYLVGTISPYNTLQGGDTLFFTAGNKAYIDLVNFKGNSTSPLVVINQGGTVFVGKHFSYGIKIGGCRYIKMTGTGSSAFYGFQVTQTNGDGVPIGDLSSDISIDHISVDSCGMAGVRAKTDPGCGGYASRNSFTQYNTIIHDCLITHTTDEGMYLGNSFYQYGETVSCNGHDSTLLPSLLNGCQVYNNILRHIGYDGIQLACCTIGMSVHDNLIQWDSQSYTYGQSDGILIGGGSSGDCYNNYIENGLGSGIDYFGLGASRIYNNVIVNEGKVGTSEDGIYVNDNTMLLGAELDIMFNTIINPRHWGIDFESSKATASVIADNCIINTTGNYINNGGAAITITNNYSNTTIANANFKDTTYRTNPGSPLTDAGWSNGKGITADKYGDIRPQGVTYDIGVYESSGSTNNPTVTTDTATIITQTSASSGGDVTSIGGTSVTARGACWNTTPNPISTGNHTSDGIGLGFFVSNITGLTGGILYHVRAYATNSSGTSYGNDNIFTTLTQLSVTTTAVTAITQTTATSGGNVTSTGGISVTARGVCWNTTLNPIATGNHTSDGTGLGLFVSNITGLTGGILYHVRAYATNSSGTAYGNDNTFTTLTLLTVTTDTVTTITQTTATSGGIVTSDGGQAVIVRGVCWSTSASPTIANNKTSDGTGTGAYVSNLTGMTSGTLYYIRAYATNVNGTGYGNQRSFTTLKPSALATVTTNTVTNIQSTTATCGGNVTSDGGASVTARGVCWNTSSNPTKNNSHTSNGTGTGSFTSLITGLRTHTRYYVRAYATNSIGTAYGNQQIFTTLRYSVKDDEVIDTTISNVVPSTLEVYPNPSRSTITVAFYLPEKSNINLSVREVNGMTMFQEQLNDQPSGLQNMKVNTSFLKEGMYIVVVITDKMTVTRKFIKID